MTFLKSSKHHSHYLNLTCPLTIALVIDGHAQPGVLAIRYEREVLDSSKSYFSETIVFFLKNIISKSTFEKKKNTLKITFKKFGQTFVA